MKQENTTKTETEKTPVPDAGVIKQALKDAWNVREIPVSVSYPFLGNMPITFFFKILMSRQEKEMRQNFSGLDQNERDAGKHAYHVELAASLMTRLPEGVPGLEIETASLDESRAAFVEFFSTAGVPLNELILDDALGLYFAKILPREYLQRY